MPQFASAEWPQELAEIDARRARTQLMGGAESLARTRARGMLNARERVERLIDPASFREFGALTGKGRYDRSGALEQFTPSAHVLGLANIEGRKTVVVSDDFTLRGGSSEASVAEKWIYSDRYAYEYRMPIVRIVHSAGGSVNLPMQMGYTKIPGYALLPSVPLLGLVPVVGVVMGPAAGLGAIRAGTSHFSVLARGQGQVFAGGPPVVKQALGITVDKESLGGWDVHKASGVIHNGADSEEDALAQARRFLSYLPANVYQQAPRLHRGDPPSRMEAWLNDAIPRDRRKIFEPRRILAALFDRDSLFEMARHFGGSLVTCLARLDGHAVGVMINDPKVMGGALTREAAQKMERFVDLCDTFHLPIVNLVDQPGSMTGPVAERAGTIAAVLRASAAIEQSSVPWLAIVIRRCFGLAGGMLSPWNGASDTALPHRFAWPSARWGSIPIEGGVDAAYAREIEAAADPQARRAELEAQVHAVASPLRTAERFGVVDVIEPATTRQLLCEWAEDAHAVCATPAGRGGAPCAESDLHDKRNQALTQNTTPAQALDDYERRRAQAEAMGSADKLARRREAGRLDARARLDRLFDSGSFSEVGLFAYTGPDPALAPADGKVVGFGRIGGREAGAVSNDFTVMGASSTIVNGRKIGHMKRVASQRGLPLVFLGESSGARIPESMGAAGMGASGSDPTQYMRLRETPWAAAILGPCFGSASWYSCLSDFKVMRRGALLSVSSAQLVKQATGASVDAEDLGGWKLHSEATGLVDLVVDSDEEAIDAVRRFLSYLPSHSQEAPPLRPVPAGSGAAMASIAALLPDNRTQVYDMKKLLRAVADSDSFFELKANFGKTGITALARIGGRSVGLIASNPMQRGGALQIEACQKIAAFIVLCDSFNIPLVNFVDVPGFAIGLDAELKAAPARIMNYMSALQLATVPKFTVIVRKLYGLYLNMGGGRNSDEVAVWPTGEVGFMAAAAGVTVVHGLAPGDAGYEEAVAEFERETSPWVMAGHFSVQQVLRPRDTRDWLIRMLEVHQLRATGGVGRHLLQTWPCYL